MDGVLDPELTFERFVVDAGNRMAAAAARRAAESPGRSYNPLVIFGPEGIGKTHLLHAIGHRALAVEPGLAVRYETVEGFVGRLAACVAAGDLDRFREENLRIGFLLLDDLQQAAGKPRTQQELLGLCEEMVRWEVQLVVAADRPLHEIPDLREDLRAVLASGLVVDLAPPEPAPPERDEFGALVSEVRSAVAEVVDSEAARRIGRAGEVAIDSWFLDREKLAWEWVALEERITEERD